MQIRFVPRDLVMCYTTLLEAIEHVFHKKEAYIEAMENSNSRNSIDTIIGLILDASKK